MGGATGRVGDPSGRVHEREEMDEERLAANTVSITCSLQEIFHNDQEMRGKGPDAGSVIRVGWGESSIILISC